MVSSRTKLISFFLLSSLIGASVVYFLVSTFELRVFYSISFFFFSFCLQAYIFSDSTFKIRTIERRAYSLEITKVLTSAYTWVILASLVIVLIPSPPVSIDSNGIYLSFLSLSPVQLLRVVLGYFFVAFFPGKIIYELFLKSRYHLDRFEQLGLTIAISFIFSIILGLILLQVAGEITSSYFVGSTWLFILPVLMSRIIKEKASKDEQVGVRTLSVGYSLGVLLLLSAILLVSSYVVHMFSQPISGIYSGDLTFYIKWADEFVNFGSTFSPYLWFQVYMKITSIITGLPLLFSLAGLQFFVLLPIVSFYMLMKNLFPHYAKCPTITAVFIFIQGLFVVPTVIVLAGTPALYKEYMSGNILSVLTPYVSGTGSGGATWLSAFSNLIVVALGAFALTFAYRYFSEGNLKGRLVDMFLAALFLVTTLFSNGIFFIPLFFLILTVFLLSQDIQSGSKKLALLIGLATILLLALDFLNGWHFLFRGSQTSSYFLTHYWPILPAIVFVVYVKEKTHARINVRISAQTTPRILGKSLLWISLLTIFLAALGLGVFEWGVPLNAIRVVSFPPVFPWYVYVLNYGFPLLITIGGLRVLMGVDQKRPLVFILVWLFSLMFLGLLGPYLLTSVIPFLPNTETSAFHRFMVQIVYLTSGLGAVVLSNFKPVITSKWFKRLEISSTQILSLTFTLMVAMSFLYIPFGTQYYLTVGNPSEYYNSPMEAKALTWANLNISDNSIILSLSQSSYLKLSALTRLKVIPPETMSVNISAFARTTEKVIIADDQQNKFWTTEPAGVGKYEVLISDDANTKTNGADSLKINVTNGSYSTWYIRHNFLPAANWNDRDMVYLNFYGANSGMSFVFQIWTPDVHNRGSFLFKDDFRGWKQLAFPLTKLNTIGTFNLTNVAVMKISPESVSWTTLGVWYIDQIVTARRFIDEVSLQEFLYNHLQSLRISYIYVTSTDLSTLGGKEDTSFFLSTISTFPIAYKNDEVTIYMVPS